MKYFLCIALTLATGATLVAQPYKDKTLSPEERAADLVSRLSLVEKAEMTMASSQAVGRLGVPAYDWWNEALHGVGRNGKATSFPMPIGMAASFDEPLLEQVFTCVSDEARIKYRQARDSGEVRRNRGLTFWTPNINIFRDPRWGRGMETYGEDPYLTGTLGMAVVRGLQGPADSPVVKTHACAKHYAVHSGPESERHRFDAVVSERDLRETYLPAFKDLVTKAGVQEVMTAYNRFRGVPCGASDYLINDILRGEWGFKGIITSDCGAISDFHRPGDHGYSRDAAEASAAAVHAGVDTECGHNYRHIPEAVERGLLNEKDLDRNLRRLIAARIRLGEFDREDTVWDHLPDSLVECASHRELARKMALESLVLLQNRGDLLPLRPDKRIALIGPNYDNPMMQLGNYNGRPEHIVTLKDGLEALIPGLESFAACGLISEEFQGRIRTDEYTCAHALAHSEVLERLKDIDIVIFAGGISPRLEGEDLPVRDVPGFMGGDRTSLEMPQVQRSLIRALHDAGKRVVLVNFSGCAMGLVPETETCDAILQAWYPGQEGGAAIARVLMGLDSPGGRLPVTFYRSVEQLPDFHDYSMRGHTYRFFEGVPLYPFGYGLGYTTFRYGRARVRRDRIVIPVTNTGRQEGEEVVQLYIRHREDKSGPSKTLRGYKRVHIPAGKTVKVSIPLDDNTFLWWSEERQDMVPADRKQFELLYGSSSEMLIRAK